MALRGSSRRASRLLSTARTPRALTTLSLCRCVKKDNCRAFTYNIESKNCYLKDVCLRLRKDRSANDISGIFLRDVTSENKTAGESQADRRS